MKFLIRFYCALGVCCALGVSAVFRVILTKISKRSRKAVQWNGGRKITIYVLVVL